MVKHGNALVPGSSPTPVRDSQPRPENSPTTTPRRALFDSPSPDAQPIELERSQRTRTPSSRKREFLSSQASAPVSDTPTGPKSALVPSKPRKSKKRAVVVSASENDEEPTGARPAPNQSTTRPSSHSKPAARTLKVAPTHSSNPCSAQPTVTLNSDTTAALGKFFGVDFNQTSSKDFGNTVQSFSDNQAAQVEPSKRYSKVRGSSPSPLSTLNKQGGYHRNHLIALVSSSLAAAKRSSPNEDARETKQARLSSHDQPDFDQLDADELNADPFANDEALSDRDLSLPPLPPPVVGTQISHPLSVSSTQRAVVNTPLVRQPILEPSSAMRSYRSGHSITEMAASRRGFAITPVPEPQQTRRSTGHQAGTSKSRQQPPSNNTPPRATAHKAPPAPALPRRAPNPETPTESEPEPELPHNPLSPSLAQPPNPDYRPSLLNSGRRKDPLSSSQDQDELTERLKHILAGGDPDAVADWAVHFLNERKARSNADHSKPGPSKPRAQRDAPNDLHARYRDSIRARSSDDVRRHSKYPRLEDPPSPASGSESDDLPEPQEIAAAMAAAAANAIPPVVQDDKNGLGKYKGVCRKVASSAIIELCAVAVQRGVYQSQETYMKWSLNCYRRAWKKLVANKTYTDPPDDLLKTMSIRISWLRTTVKERIRGVVHNKLRFRRPGSDEAKVANNQRLFAKLFPDTFHCRDYKTDNDQYESTAFISAICCAFFWTADSFVIQHHSRFKILPLPAVAFVLTMMQEGIEEWQSGRFQSRDLHFAKQQPIFDAHLRGLYVYEHAAEERMHDFQEAWFRCGMEYAGVTIHDPENAGEGRYCQPITRAENVRPDTPNRERVIRDKLDPEPESDESAPEDEAEYGRDGRLTKGSKGKSKAGRETNWD